ncbi:MAG: sugar-binding transcriptional regulator [Bacteroidales bacterium]|nr:sugar-binding transcriptional regulator [Bacteroidales bacterium]
MVKDKLIYKVLYNYYEKGLTQQEVADKYHISRIKVSRMITKALTDKIVQVRINLPTDPTDELEQRIEEIFGIEEAIVVPVRSGNIVDDLGQAAASYLALHIQNHDIIGITWGRFVSASINALQPMNCPDIRVVQILGGLGDPDSGIHGTGQVIRMANVLKAKPWPLNSPGIVKSKELREALMENAQISETLKLAEKATIVLAGIGTFHPTASLRNKSEIISENEIQSLVMKGAVGNISLRSFDEQGNYIRDDIDDRVVGLTCDQIRRIPRFIGVAGGIEKHQAILAALRGKWINTIITDDQTAKFLIGSSNLPERSGI